MRWTLLLVALLGAPALADEVRVAGQPLAALTAGSGARLMVELDPLLTALDAPHHPTYSGVCVTQKPEPEDCKAAELAGPNQVIVEGKPVPTKLQGGKLMVELKPFAQQLGLKLSNPAPAVVEVDAPWTIHPLVAGYEPPVLPSTKPGETVDVAKLLQPGRTNVVLFYTDWCPACWKWWPFLSSLNRSQSGFALVAVDISDFKSPVARQYQVRATPTLQVYDGSGQRLKSGDEAESWIADTYHATLPSTLKCVGSPDK